MKDRTKTLLKDSFGSLVSNDRALAAAKTSPIWLTIIIFFLAVLLPLVPITTSYASVSGASGVNANSYGLKNTVSHFALEMYKDGNTLVVNDENQLDITNTDVTPIYEYKNSITNLTELRVFVAGYDNKGKTTAEINGKTKTVKNQEKYVNDIYENFKEVVSEEGDTKTYSMSSFMVFFKDVYTFFTFKQGTDVAGTSFQGDYKSFKPGTDLYKLLVESSKTTEITKPASSEEIKTMLANNVEIENTIFNNYKTFLKVSYRTAKDRSTLYSTLIFGGIYLGLSLLMALIIWLLTRGKNNPFNYMSLLTTFKIESWISLAPGLIGLLLGLILPLQMSIKMMLFIAPLGFRVMFLLTKQLRPMQ